MMKPKILISLIFMIVIIFSYGIIVGHYQIFPFEILSDFNQIIQNKNTQSESRPQIYQDPSQINDLITIYSEDDIKIKKRLLNNYIWSNNDPPFNKMPDDYSINIQDNIFSDIDSLLQINSYTVEMTYGMNSISYLFLPKISNNDLIIYHQGHTSNSLRGYDSHSFEQDKEIIKNFLDNNYSVLIFSMPGKGMNNEPVVDIPKFGKVTLNSHDHFKLIESETLKPIKFFIEPVIITLNHIEKNHNFESFNMIGLSGGGWNTVIVSALDDRIQKSYSVAGSFPIWMRSSPSDFGDYEQTIPEFYKIANYEELYIMSAYGQDRELILFYNEFDPCCFSGELYKKFPFKNIIQEKLQSLEKGEFDVIIDSDQNEHIISDSTFEMINKLLLN
jgi:hypothetical protein